MIITEKIYVNIQIILYNYKAPALQYTQYYNTVYGFSHDRIYHRIMISASDF